MVEYDDGSTCPILGALPIQSITTTTFNNTSGTRGMALKFAVPFPCRITGCWVWCDFDADFDVKLYEGNASTIAGVTLKTDLSMDADVDATATATIYLIEFDNTVNLTANTVYRLVFEPSASNISLYDIVVASAAYMDAMAGGQDFALSTHDGTNWTDVATKRLLAGIVLDAFDDGAGGGGGARSNRGLLTGGGMGA